MSREFVWAIDDKGQLSKCYAKPENRGKRRCSHKVFANEGESSGNLVARYKVSIDGFVDPYREMKKDAGIVDQNIQLEDNKDAFKMNLDNAKASNKKYGGYVDTHTLEELQEWDTYISDDGTAGVAVKEDGDITCLFSNKNKNKRRPSAPDLIITARDHGGTKMDCYGVRLVNMYEQYGFEVVARVPFDPTYVTDEELLKNPQDVYFLKRTRQSTEEVIDTYRTKTFHQSTQAELDDLPTYDYDAAGEYRDSLLEKEKLSE